ncbi:MAG: hypothetical protein P8X43_12995, partial [Maritimibacter sp.]
MKLYAADLISRATVSSARVLITLSAAAIAVERYDLNTVQWEFAGRSIQPEHFREIAIVVLLYSAVSLCVHWYADYVSYTKWFKEAKVGVDDLLSLGEHEDTLADLVGRITLLRKSLEETAI